MDVDIVNAILRLCVEQQTRLFEVPVLGEYCLKKCLCTHSKHVLASVTNYPEIFKISRDRNRIELSMPFELCRNRCFDALNQNNGEVCSNLHVCYDYFCTPSCRRSSHCPYPHVFTEEQHGTILGTLIHLDLDALTRAFRVYCQLKKRLLNYNPPGPPLSKGQQPAPVPLIPNATSASTSAPSSNGNQRRLTVTAQISSNASWKKINRSTEARKTPPTQPQEQSLPKTQENGIQLSWTPHKDIQSHFIEVIFTNPNKCGGGPFRTHRIYQQLGIAQVFYQASDIADRVVQHGAVTFQSFTFTPRLLSRTIDQRRVCFANMPVESHHHTSYIDTVSMPYIRQHLEYYLNDKQTIVVGYNEDIDFSKISSNVRSHPECDGLSIQCIQLYHPETLLVEFDETLAEYELEKLLQDQRIFHIRSQSSCAFVHFHSYDDLLQTSKASFSDQFRAIPIYIDIFSPGHLENYLQQRKVERQSKPLPTITTEKSEDSMRHEPSPVPSDSSHEPASPEPIVVAATTNGPTDTVSESDEEDPITTAPPLASEMSIAEAPLPTDLTENADGAETLDLTPHENDPEVSDDDFHDLPSEFDDDDFPLDDAGHTNDDIEFLRSAAKTFMTSLSDMDDASANTDTDDAPRTLFYGDDYVVTIQNRQFAIAFLDYTQFRIDKQRNPDKFRLLASLKKTSTQRKRTNPDENRLDHAGLALPAPTPLSTSFLEPELLSMIGTKGNKKKRSKRNKRKRAMNQNNNAEKTERTSESVHDEDDDEDNTTHVLNDEEYDKNGLSFQRLPHVYLDNDLKPCIVVAGEENGHETSEHEDWHDIKAGGKSAPVPKKSQNKKDQPRPEENLVSAKIVEEIPATPTVPAPPKFPTSMPSTDANALIIPPACRGFVHHPKMFEAFRLRLRRSFPTISIRFQPNTYHIAIDGNVKANVQQCLTYLHALATHKRSIRVSYADFPSTTTSNVIRMQQSTAQVKLDSRADYHRIFRSAARLLDHHLKQQYNQQQCIYCRRTKKQFLITYLQFPVDKGNAQEFQASVRERVLQLLQTRFVYIAIALSGDLMRTKRWMSFYKSLTEHKDLNKTLLIRKIDTIVQVYGLHAHVQQIQALITIFLDANRFETDVIETEQASGIYSLFKVDFQEMEKLESFREAELHFIYRHRRSLLLVQCFQERFEQVKSHIQKLRSHLSTLVLPIKSPILSRYFSKSDELQRIAAGSACIITAESPRTTDCLINVKIIGRSLESIIKAQRLIKAFEEKNYQKRQIHHNNIHLFNEHDIEALQNECQTNNVSYVIDASNNNIELEGLADDFPRVEKFIQELSSIAARRVVDDLQNSTQWVYHDPATNRPVMFGETIKRQLEAAYEKHQKGPMDFKDHTGHIRTFHLEKMVEIVRSNSSSSSTTMVKIERRDLRNPQPVHLPANWTLMTGAWERILIAKRENLAEWKANGEVQRLLKLQHMLPESWITEVFRVQNPRMYQQYMARKNNLATRCQNPERTLYCLLQMNLIDDVCAHGFNRSHTDAAFSAYGDGCHFYSKAIDIDRTVTLSEQNLRATPVILQGQSAGKAPMRFLFVCKVLVGRFIRGDASLKTCPAGYDSTVDNPSSPEVYVPHHDTQALPEYLLAYQSAIF